MISMQALKSSVIVVVPLLLAGCLFTPLGHPPESDVGSGQTDTGQTDTGVDCTDHQLHDGHCQPECPSDPDCPHCKNEECASDETEVPYCDTDDERCRSIETCDGTLHCMVNVECEIECSAGWEMVETCGTDKLCQTQHVCGNDVVCQRAECNSERCEMGYHDIGDSCDGSGPDNCYINDGCGWPIACDKCDEKCPVDTIQVYDCANSTRCSMLSRCGGGELHCQKDCAITCDEGSTPHHTCEACSDTEKTTVCGVGFYCVKEEMCTERKCRAGTSRCEPGTEGCNAQISCGELVYCK